MNPNIEAAANYIANKIHFTPKAGIILGTGLNSLVDLVENQIIIPYAEIPGFIATTAPGHVGNLICGTLSNMPIVLFQGRFHFYEGHPMSQVVFPVRVLKKLGAEYLFVTNAAGSLNEDFTPGKLVLLEDHFNFMGTNPLIGTNDESIGERFPSMHEPYDHFLRVKAQQIATDNNISLPSGIYLAVSGPSLETRAECKVFAKWGMDLVGMSTVPEVIAAKHAGLRVLGISVVTNLSNIFHSNPHSQEEIRANALTAKEDLMLIIRKLVQELA